MMQHLEAQNTTMDLSKETNYYASIKYMVHLSIVCVIILASLAVFIVVIKRRRTELFILSIPFLFVLYGILSIVLYFHLLSWDNNRIRFFNTEYGQDVLISISNYSFAISYWIFAF